MSGFIDGEGSIRKKIPYHPAIDIPQKIGITATKAETILKEKEIFYRRTLENTRKHRNIVHLNISRREGALRLLGTVRPERLLQHVDPDETRSIRNKNPNLEIISVRKLGKRKIIGLGTSSHTYLSEGFGSHNCFRELYQGIHLMAEGEINYDWGSLLNYMENKHGFVSSALKTVENNRHQISDSTITAAQADFQQLDNLLDSAHNSSPLPDTYNGRTKAEKMLILWRTQGLTNVEE